MASKRKRHFDEIADNEHTQNENARKRRKLSINTNKCEWSGRYGDFTKHLNKECKYNTIRCPYCIYGCKEKLLTADMSSHVKICKYSTIKCPRCRKLVSKMHLTFHIKSICEETIVSCPKCGEQIKRGDMDDHAENICDQEMTPCEYKQYGCRDVKRADMDDHEEDNVAFHLLLMKEKMASHFRSNRMELDELRARNEELEERLDVVNHVISEHMNIDCSRFDDMLH